MKSFKITRRNLPHWQEPGSVYFVTWNCLKGQILSGEERRLTLEAFRYWDGRKWTVYAVVIMPDHVHALVQPLPHPECGFFDLGAILHSVKSFTSHQINKLRGTKGSIWQDERLDRVVRDDAELTQKWGYIQQNPVEAGLADDPGDYPWLYECQNL